MGYKGNHSSTMAVNASSVLDNPGATEAKIAEEIKLGRIAGPFTLPPFRNFKISPLSLREKANGKVRLLHNLTAPYDEDSVNLCIPDKHAKVTYASIADATAIIATMPGCYLAKADIKSAFRLVPIHPEDHHLLGFHFKNKYYYDKCLPMGCRSSCKLFQKISDAIVHILKKHYGVTNVVNYLDDFLFIGETSDLCDIQLKAFYELCNDIGCPIAVEKTEGPATKLVFLGYHLDTKAMVVSIPADKLATYEADIQAILDSPTATLKAVKSLIGKLVFVASIIRVARAFLRRLINVTMGKTKPNMILFIDDYIKKDLKMWLMFFNYYNGQNVIVRQFNYSSEAINLGSDASKSGFAGTYGSKFFYGSFPESWKAYDIKVLELFPIFLLVELFGHKLRNSCIIFHCDNKTIVDVINKQSSKSTKVMALLRPMVLVLLRNNIMFQALHVPGKENILNDKLSRNKVTPQLLAQFGMDTTPVAVPRHLLPQNFRL